MKRKLIDLSDEVLKKLSVQAAENGCSLKRYIEKSLERQAFLLKDSDEYADDYRFGCGMDPLDSQLAAITAAAAQKAAHNKLVTEESYFNDIASSIAQL